MTKTIIANWKMALSLAKSLDLLKKFKVELESLPTKHRLVVCPDFLSLGYLAALKGEQRTFPFFLGAQTAGHLQFGALTGEIASANLKKIGLTYLILGHSDRRQVGETNDLIKEKMLISLKNKLRPIICLGEEKKQSRAKTNLFIEKQLTEIFLKLTNSDLKKIIIAYEPVWAIGSQQACSPQQAKQVHGLIKDFFRQKYQTAPAVVYGGSVNGHNASRFLSQENIDGLLVGGASLSWSQFKKIIN